MRWGSSSVVRTRSAHPSAVLLLVLAVCACTALRASAAASAQSAAAPMYRIHFPRMGSAAPRQHPSHKEQSGDTVGEHADSESSHEPPHGGSDAPHAVDSGSYAVTTATGQRLLCKLPPPATPAPPLPPVSTSESQDATLDGDEKSRRARWLRSLDTFLEMNANNCFFRVDGWWTYEFCPGRYVRQIHFADQHSKRAEISLGSLDSIADAVARAQFLAKTASGEDTSTQRQNSMFDHKYMSRSLDFEQSYVDGDVCDLSGTPRTTTVVYRCAKRGAGLASSKTRVLQGAGDYIGSVFEVRSCVYTLDFISEALCEQGQMREEQHVYDIECSLAPGESAFRGLTGVQPYRRSPWL